MRLAVLLHCAVVAAVVLVGAGRVSAGCCDECLSQRDPAHSVITYDPLIHDQCSPAKGICCYGCSFGHGSPSYESGVDFNDQGEPQTTAGRQVTFSISGVTRVTYDFLANKQAKTSFVGNRSTEAKLVQSDDGSVFTFCARSAGTIQFRGWGSDSCKQVTEEYSIKVVAGDGALTCDAGAVKPASPTTKPVSPSTGGGGAGGDTTKTGADDVDNCSATRGTVKTRGDGSKYCECLGDWRNPPACDQYSWTKTIVTVLGALAAVFSIAFSVRAYLKSKKAEKEAAHQDLDMMTEDEIETMRISPAKGRQSTTSAGRQSNMSTTSTVMSMGASPVPTSAMASSGGPRRTPPRSPVMHPSMTPTGVATTQVRTSRETTL